MSPRLRLVHRDVKPAKVALPRVLSVRFATGDRVAVVGGTEVGQTGRIVEQSPFDFDGEPVIDVKLETGYVRPLRTSFLRLLEVER